MWLQCYGAVGAVLFQTVLWLQCYGSMKHEAVLRLQLFFRMKLKFSEASSF